MKHLILAFALLPAAAFAATNATTDAFAAPDLKNVKLLGVAGQQADACIRARAYSDWARGAMYDECVNAFRTHWDDTDGRTGWQNEYWGKTMLCFAGAVAYTQDPSLKDWTTRHMADFLKEFQKPNGYLSTYQQEDLLRRDPTNPDSKQHWCFNVWGRKYTFWALIDIYRTTGDKRALDGAVKMADHLIAQLKRLNLMIDKTGAWNGVSSMSILRPVLELYRITDKPAYLQLAKDIVHAMDAEPMTPTTLIRNAFRTDKICTWFPEATFWAKAYEIQSCLEGLVDYYRLTGERRVLDAVLAFHRHLIEEELNPMRSAGLFDHFLDARHRVNGMTELCDVTHWIRLNRELLLVTGDAKYADMIEEAFYNAFLAGVSRDGRWGAHIIRSHGTRHLAAPPQTGMREHQCCPDNMMRTYFDVAGSVGGMAPDGTLNVALYADAVAAFPNAQVSISGGYPYADTPVTVTIDRTAAGRVKFRIPRWSQTFKLNGKTVTAKDGWYAVDAPAGLSAWTLAFDLSPRLEEIPVSEEYIPPSPQRYSIEVPKYTVHFMEWYTPDMAGLTRSVAGTLVLRGPLVLAKGRLAGTSRAETLFATSIKDNAWKATLTPAPTTAENAGVTRAWTLTLSHGPELKTIPVADFASVSNVDDPGNWFSLWF